MINTILLQSTVYSLNIRQYFLKQKPIILSLHKFIKKLSKYNSIKFLNLSNIINIIFFTHKLKEYNKYTLSIYNSNFNKFKLFST